MTEQEAREVIKAHKWSFLLRTRKSRDYVNAARKVHGQRQEIYIGSLKVVQSWTAEILVEKLASAKTDRNPCSNTTPSQDNSDRGQEQQTSTNSTI